MEVTDASASEAVTKLEDEKLVCRAPYKGFTLSPAGKEKGQEIAHKHEKLKSFFANIGLDNPGKEATKIETHISRDAVRKIEDQFL